MGRADAAQGPGRRPKASSSKHTSKVASSRAGSGRGCPQRLPGPLAQVPTAREQGLDLVWPTVRGIYMGPDVPERSYQEWVKTLRRLMATREFAQLARARGLEPAPMAGAELEAHVRGEVARMRELARGLGLRVP